MYRVYVPNGLDLDQSIAFVKALQSLPEDDEYVFDFNNVGNIEPFALLFVSSEIQRYRESKPDCMFKAVNYDRCQYAAHMGFFRAFNVQYGNRPGQATGSSTYIPIRIYWPEQIREVAAIEKVPPAKFLEGMAKQMSKMLTRSTSGSLYDTLWYSIREILRNVLEHSQTVQFGLCGQYWPSKNKVSLAILDRGKGIRSALSENPNLSIQCDEDALKLAIQPGISGVAFEGSYQDPDDAWLNSGYGLFMTSNICKRGGSFFIASGSKGLYLSEHNTQVLDTPFQGTALNLTLRTDRLSNLQDVLDELSQEGKISSSRSPSMSSRSTS